MRKSQYSDEQIVKIVRESHAQGVAETAKKYKVSENAIYIWRRKFGGMEPNQVSELKRIMQENARLKKIVAERIVFVGLTWHQCDVVHQVRESFECHQVLA